MDRINHHAKVMRTKEARMYGRYLASEPRRIYQGGPQWFTVVSGADSGVQFKRRRRRPEGATVASGILGCMMATALMP